MFDEFGELDWSEIRWQAGEDVIWHQTLNFKGDLPEPNLPKILDDDYEIPF